MIILRQGLGDSFRQGLGLGLDDSYYLIILQKYGSILEISSIKWESKLRKTTQEKKMKQE